jgi:hypothetical protein
MPLPTPIEACEAFRKGFRLDGCYREFRAVDEERLATRIPEVMLLILKKDGWSSYRKQALWLCDPDDWAVAARAWFPHGSRADVVVRTAFGDLFVLVDGTFFRVMPHESSMRQGISSATYFFGFTLTRQGYVDSPARVQRARSVAGPLEWDQMYTYVPALALGGSEKTSKLELVKAREQLVILSQMAPIQRS